jgi:hypothetical protein
MNQVMDHITASPKGLDQAHQHQMGHVQQMSPGPFTPDFDWNYWTNVVAEFLRSPPPKPSTAVSTGPELNPDDQAMDPQAANYAAKGKAKQLRR